MAFMNGTGLERERERERERETGVGIYSEIFSRNPPC
jgi:hypothetical protein